MSALAITNRSKLHGKEVNSRLNSGNDYYHLIQKKSTLGQCHISQETES